MKPHFSEKLGVINPERALVKQEPSSERLGLPAPKLPLGMQKSGSERLGEADP